MRGPLIAINKAAMNGAQTHLGGKETWMAESVSGPPAEVDEEAEHLKIAAG
jgi:hypothetical protein